MWIVFIHPNDTILVARDDRHLTVSEEEVSISHANAVNVSGENNQFVRILLPRV